MRKKKYFIIWVEGFHYTSGEKVKQLTDTGFDYTYKLTEALRIKEDDIEPMRAYMKRHGIAQFVIDSNYTFIPTSYAPKGTILNTKRITF
jgi:hypothetical protein